MKTLATIQKEFLVLIRDPGGLALIFLMPLMLVVIMALVQDAPFRDYQEFKLDVVLVDLDNNVLGARVKKDFESAGNVVFYSEQDSARAQQLVRGGKYKAAIIIPAKASDKLRIKSQQLVSKLLSDLGMPSSDSIFSELDSIKFSVLFDPAIKANYRQNLTNAMDKVLTSVQSEWMLTELQNQLGSDTSKNTELDFSNFVTIDQVYATDNKLNGVILNSVQHNVPAWAMFAMFFILFPLAGNFIREREDGSMLRLRLISNSYFPVITGKFLLYFLVCLSQFFVMMMAGIFLMPVIGLQTLSLGNNLSGIFLAASCVALAATSYGLLIATSFRTPQQALSFGSISVVILAAVGGIWVPVFVMPAGLQTISSFSPLNWSLTIFNDLFLRGATIEEIFPDMLKLLSFSGVALTLSIFVHRGRD